MKKLILLSVLAIVVASCGYEMRLERNQSHQNQN